MYTIKTKSSVREFSDYDAACNYLQKLTKQMSKHVELSDSFMPMGYRLVNGQLVKKVEVVKQQVHYIKNMRKRVKLIYTTVNV